MKIKIYLLLSFLISISLFLCKVSYSLFSDDALSLSNSFSANSVNQVYLEPQEIASTGGIFKFPLNETVEINLILKNGAFETESLEVIINFDPQVISINSLDFTTNTVLHLDNSLIEEIDNEQGRIYLARTIYSFPYDPPYNPIPPFSQGIVGTITINTVGLSENSSLSFYFQKGERNDCNLVKFQQAEDILESALNLDFSVINQ